MTTTFSVTRDDVINASLRLLGVLAEGETASAEDLTNCAQAMNILLKKWADQGYKGWLYATASFPFVASREFWTVGPTGQVVTNRPQRIADAWYEQTVSGGLTQRFPMFMLERERFFKLSPKDQTSTAPANWYYDPQLDNGLFYPWPLCLDTNGTFFISVQRPIEDILAGANVVQIPQTWYAALKWNLADEVGLEYRPHPDVLDRIERKAPLYLASCSNLEEEQGSIMFTPGPSGVGYGGGRRF